MFIGCYNKTTSNQLLFCGKPLSAITKKYKYGTDTIGFMSTSCSVRDFGARMFKAKRQCDHFWVTDENGVVECINCGKVLENDESE